MLYLAGLTINKSLDGVDISWCSWLTSVAPEVSVLSAAVRENFPAFFTAFFMPSIWLYIFPSASHQPRSSSLAMSPPSRRLFSSLAREHWSSLCLADDVVGERAKRDSRRFAGCSRRQMKYTHKRKPMNPILPFTQMLLLRIMPG